MGTKLCDVCEMIPGYAFKSKDFGDYPTKVIKITQINPPFVEIDDCVGIDLSNYDVHKLEKFKAVTGDFCFAMTGATLGKIGRITKGEAYLNQRVLMFRPYKSTDKKFLYYSLLMPSFVKFVWNHIDSDSAQPNISAATLGNFEIPSFDLSTQKKIASVLFSLDTKIELNNKINKNLEEIVQTLYKRWFVDFEFPNENGESYKSSGGEMVDSELGMIPKGWSIGFFNDMIKRTIGGDWGKESLIDNYDQKVACVRGADIPALNNGEVLKFPRRFILKKNLDNKGLKPGNIVIEISGGSPTQSTGRSAFITKAITDRFSNRIVCTNFCRAIEPNNLEYSAFIFSSIRYLYDLKIFFNYENGTTGIKNLDINRLLTSHEIVIPSMKVLHNFNVMFSEAIEMMQKNGIQTEVLSRIRDELLPKLMNGDIEVPVEE